MVTPLLESNRRPARDRLQAQSDPGVQAVEAAPVVASSEDPASAVDSARWHRESMGRQDEACAGMSMYIPHGELTPYVQYHTPFVSFAEQRERAAGAGKADIEGSDPVDLQAHHVHVGSSHPLDCGTMVIPRPVDMDSDCGGAFSLETMPDVDADGEKVLDRSAPSGDKTGGGSSVEGGAQSYKLLSTSAGLIARSSSPFSTARLSARSRPRRTSDSCCRKWISPTCLHP